MKENKFTMFFLMFVLFIVMSGIGLIIPIMPAFLETFGAGGKALGILIALFSFGQFLFSPIAGDLSDRYGRKYFIFGGLLLYGFSTLAFAFVDELWLLFVFRFLTGIGAALIIPPIMAFVSDVTTFEERGKAMGLSGASMSLGFMFGPVIGGLLSNIGITFPFTVSGVITLLCAVSLLFLLPNIKKENAEITKRENLIKQLLSSTKKSYFVILIVVFTFSFGISNFQATLSIFLTDKFNYSPTDIAIIMTLGGFLGVLIQSLWVGKLFDKFGERNVLLFSLLLSAVSISLIVFVSGFFMVAFVASIFFIATTLIRPSVNTLISKRAENEQGFAAGMNNAYMSLGSMVGPILAGILYDIDMNIPYFFGAFVLFISFLILLKSKK